MRPARPLAILALLAAAFLFPTGATSAQGRGDDCALMRDELLFSDPKIQYQQKQAPSSDFLFGGSDTVRCLVEIMGEMRRSVRSSKIDPQMLGQLVRVTGVVRSILTTQGASAIRSFRRFDNPDSTIVLAFAARSDDPNLRINATLILADVIDNTTVCVPIDHLYDPALLESAGGDSGRVNLVGVVSVVAPWSYRENFDNITRLAIKLRNDIAGQDNVAQTKDVLNNLQTRLEFQSTLKAPNMARPLPVGERDCAQYEPIWANARERNLFY